MLTTCGQQSVSPALVSMFFNVETLYAYLLDVYCFEISLNVWQFLGCGLVVAFSIASVIEKHRSTQKD